MRAGVGLLTRNIIISGIQDDSWEGRFVNYYHKNINIENPEASTY